MIPQIDCSMGLSTFALEWMMGELPSPASLEKIPRAMPARIVRAIVDPMKPPVAAIGLKA